MNWSLAPSAFRFHAACFRRIVISYHRKSVYGFDEAFRSGRVVDYRFITSEIKNPGMNTIREVGWNV